MFLGLTNSSAYLCIIQVLYFHPHHRHIWPAEGICHRKCGNCRKNGITYRHSLDLTLQVHSLCQGDFCLPLPTLGTHTACHTHSQGHTGGWTGVRVGLAMNHWHPLAQAQNPRWVCCTSHEINVQETVTLAKSRGSVCMMCIALQVTELKRIKLFSPPYRLFLLLDRKNYLFWSKRVLF